jgi:histidyl-tRNA synthetase
MQYQAPRGTRDLLPEDLPPWVEIERVCRDLCRRYAFQEIRTPVLEQTALFTRSIGEATDIVEKEMFSLKTAGGDELTLRPENTAGVVRAYLEHGFHKNRKFAKLFYIGPMFRHDRPGKGRWRQFWQFGVEVFGPDSAWIDLEVMQLAADLFRDLKLEGARAKLNSVGCPECRPKYTEALKAAFSARKDRLCGNCQARIERSVLRILDCKVAICKAVVAESAPAIRDYLCEKCREHLDTVRQGLEAAKIPHEIDPTIVRGLDYYTRNVFEYFTTGQEGTQDALGGGGRYNRLVEDLGGPPTAACGFAMGMDRIIDRMKSGGAAEAPGQRPDAVIIVATDTARQSAALLARELRGAGLAVIMDLEGRSMKKQMEAAAKSGAGAAVILGEDELRSGNVTIKEMAKNTQRAVNRSVIAAELLKIVNP